MVGKSQDERAGDTKDRASSTVKLAILVTGLSLLLGACTVAQAPAATSPARPPEVYVPTATSTSVPPTPTSTPSPTPEPTAFVCDEPGGRVIETAYPGAILAEAIPVSVYVPPCYDRVAESYPSVILLHGKPISAANWPDLGAVRLVDEGIREGTWRPFIMIMPLQPEPLFSQTDGGAGSYEAELMQGLLPFVESTFRTSREPHGRAIGGISRGGVWALEIGFRHPDVFGAVVALSPALALNYARPDYDPLEIAQLGAVVLPPQIFLGAGEGDWARTKTVALADALGAHGETPELEIVPGDHLAPTWEKLMPGMFRFLAAVWGSPSP
jgi:enterochelin esterase-like enzyme